MNFKMSFFLSFLLIFSACDKPQTEISQIQSTPLIAAQSNEKNSPVSDEKQNGKQLQQLREWIGKYPVNSDDKSRESFFELPEVRKILVQILKEDGFQNLLKHFSGTNLIKEKDGFLVMLGTTERNAEQDFDYALVALNPETSETHVFFSDNGKLTAFDNAGGDGNLTADIKKEILINTNSAQSAVIGTLKQKPEEGFQCYAVLPKDWDTIADQRPYIFVSTDTGAMLNIEGSDVELKAADSKETKGKNGKTYAEWIYKNLSAQAKFDLAIEKLLNEGADVQYEGTLTVTTNSKTQTIQIKAFCGG